MAQATRESDVEAAYLFNFAKFMHASAHAPDSFSICVVGKSPLSGTLGTITANEQIDGRSLKVVHGTTADDARNCDIAFLSDAEGPRIEKDLAVLAGSNALTVSNAGGSLQHGGMIQFEVVQNRVRFSVNLDAVNKAKITLSSELLKVAMKVTGSVSMEAQP
jgi:YfiR/HmsC-like